jgi:hypothetical protein
MPRIKIYKEVGKWAEYTPLVAKQMRPVVLFE